MRNLRSFASLGWRHRSSDELESVQSAVIAQNADVVFIHPNAPSDRMLVRMTRTRRGTRRRTPSRTGRRALQDAKACFSEVVRKAKSEDPQRITVHGREEVLVVSVE